LLGQDHNLSAGFVILHAAMCVDDLVEVEDLADLNMERPSNSPATKVAAGPI
jgi:hypothetical protein